MIPVPGNFNNKAMSRIKKITIVVLVATCFVKYQIMAAEVTESVIVVAVFVVEVFESSYKRL